MAVYLVRDELPRKPQYALFGQRNVARRLWHSLITKRAPRGHDERMIVVLKDEFAAVGHLDRPTSITDRDCLRTLETVGAKNRSAPGWLERHGGFLPALRTYHAGLDLWTRMAVARFRLASFTASGIVCESFVFEELLFVSREHKGRTTFSTLELPVNERHAPSEPRGNQ